MIDEEWIDRTFRYSIRSGYRFEGLLGVGAEKVALNFLREDGTDLVFKIDKKRFLLWSFLKEIPLELSTEPMYDLARLNLKLRDAVGDPDWHRLVQPIDELLDLYLELWRSVPVEHLDHVRGESEKETLFLRFMVQTQGMKSRIQDLVEDDSVWAEAALHAIEEIRTETASWLVEELEFNPLWIWGGAVMGGYFTKAEMPVAVRASLNELYRREPTVAAAFMFQARLLLAALRHSIEDKRVARFAVFLDCTGLYDESLSSDKDLPSMDLRNFDWLP